MKTIISVAVATALIAPGDGFLLSPINRVVSLSHTSSQCLKSSLSDDERQKAERMREILSEEAMDPTNMAASAEAMKNMTPQDMERIMSEMDNMSPVQRNQLKSMGMDPDLMKRSLQMMKSNPDMIKSAQKMMENMTPQQMMEQSKFAQQQMKDMTPEQVEQASEAISGLSEVDVEKAAQSLESLNAVLNMDGADEEVDEEDDEEDDDEEESLAVPLEGSAADPSIIDAMFRVAEIMSQPPSGGVTLKAFSTLPPIALVSGDQEIDLSARELAECWADGGMGASRVDRAGFERVWTEVREYFEGDILEEARKTSVARPKKELKTRAPAVQVAAPLSAVTQPVTPQVGANLSPEQMAMMKDQVTNLKDDDMKEMLSQMEELTPDQEARMKSMGVDPAMMKKASEMMQNNPMMRQAAQAMMKNMSPEQMVQASQRAQEQMSGMSKEDYEKAMEKMK